MIWKSENDLGREFAKISDNGGELQLECRSFRLESVIRAEAVSYIVEDGHWKICAAVLRACAGVAQACASVAQTCATFFGH